MAEVAAPQHDPELALEFEGMDRSVGFLGLLWASEGSIIGSGWLFGALAAATIAGPSAVIAWVVASIIIIILALVHAELGGLFPVTGGTSRFPHYAFGSFAGATFGWFSYMQAAAVAPIEATAAVQYMSSYSGLHGWYVNGALRGAGIVVAIGFMAVFTLVNLIGIRWLARVNNSLTTWKVLMPILTIIVLILFKFHGSNFTAAGGFFIHGAAAKSIMFAIADGGIIFALLGFEQAVQIGGESANPKRDLPRAVIGSILIGSAIYILVQVAFIGALQPHLLAEAKTWANLGPTNSNATIVAINAAPFYQVAELAGVAWLAFFLRLDAIISPTGTGLIYLTSSSRVAFGLSKNGYIPAAFERNNERFKVPWFAIFVTFGIGILFLLPFPSWQKLVGVVTLASVLMYAGAPLSLGALRASKPNLPRVYDLPAWRVMAPLAFILANFVIYWSGWGTYSTVMLVMLIGYALMGVSFALHLNPNQPKIDWQAAPWILVYMIGMGLISFFGQFPGCSLASCAKPGTGGVGFLDGIAPFQTFLIGGVGNAIPLYVDLGVVAVFSLVIYYWAMSKRLSEERVDDYVRDVYPPPVAE
ncbi:MAG: APC family permease [Solirubrobacteraceae bacterium]